jgi:hypothetical protein
MKRERHREREATADPATSSPPAVGPSDDLLAFEPVPLRFREDGLTPEKQRAYVEALADTGVAREAAARIGLSEQAINRVRRRADARSFDTACEAAHLFGARRLRSIAYERAVQGTLKGHHYHGELVSEERVYDNRLLIYLLGRTGHLLDPPAGSRAVCDDWEAHMDALEQGLPPPDQQRAEAADAEKAEWTGYEIRQDDGGIWWTSFPPPAGFEGEELGRFGEDHYERTLSAQEQSLVNADLADEEAQYRASEAARRDRFFGFAGGDILSSREAEPYETSEPSDSGLGPIEYKSACSPARVHAETRRREGSAGRNPASSFSRATAQSHFNPPLAEGHWTHHPSASPRLRVNRFPSASLSPVPRIP